MASDRSTQGSWQAVELPANVRSQLVRLRGRPAVDPVNHKQPVSIRLNKAVIAHFKADGPGWQTRLDEFLLNALAQAERQADGVLHKVMSTSGEFATKEKVRAKDGY